MPLSLKELRERRERGHTATEFRRPSGIPVEVLLLAEGEVAQPVALAKALTGFGLTLAEAHATLNRLVARESVPVTLHLTPGGELPFTLMSFGLSLGQKLEAPRPQTVEGLLPYDIVGTFESWRLSQPNQPSPPDALRLMVEAYLTEHGLITQPKRKQSVHVYESE